MTMPNEPGTGPTQPANGGGTPTPVFTQDQVNHFQAEAKRGAVGTMFKEAGLEKPLSPEELKTALANAAEYQKLQAGQQTELQTAQSQLAEASRKAEKVPTLEAQLHRQALAGEAGLKPRYWKYIEGDDDEAVKASIKAIQEDLGIGGDGSGDGDGANGTQQQPGGSTLTPNPQQGTGGGGKPPAKSMSAGADAYKARHKKE